MTKPLYDSFVELTEGQGLSPQQIAVVWEWIEDNTLALYWKRHDESMERLFRRLEDYEHELP